MEKDNIAIYGAHMVAVSVYYVIKALHKEINVRCFIVTEPSENPTAIEGVPVIGLDRFHDADVKILIATPENHHANIIAELNKRGLDNYLCIDSRMEADLMERYYSAAGEFKTLRSYPAGAHRADALAYMNKFYRDQPLKGDYTPPAWVKPIQAGAALTDCRIADICDDGGDNISAKNGNYCELTSLYWIGKHAQADYLGLFHYRRILDLQEEDLHRLPENDIDVILPYPAIYYPNIAIHHKRYLKDSDWEAMKRALKECAPAYAAALPALFAGQYFYNYNMLVAKKEIFQGYCNWLFPILERTEELSVPQGAGRADRYIGYLGENLETLYFLYHKKDFRIAHVGRRMLV